MCEFHEQLSHWNYTEKCDKDAVSDEGSTALMHAVFSGVAAAEGDCGEKERRFGIWRCVRRGMRGLASSDCPICLDRWRHRCATEAVLESIESKLVETDIMRGAMNVCMPFELTSLDPKHRQSTGF